VGNMIVPAGPEPVYADAVVKIGQRITPAFAE